MRLIPIALAALLLAACNGGAQPSAPTAPKRSVAPARVQPALADLTGKVKAPASLLANNGGGLVANNGGGLVANNGSGVVANNGATWRLSALEQGARRLQAATPWVALGGLSVTLVDARGKTAGAPITTGADGSFRFPAVSTGNAWVVRASLGEGRTLEALARAGEPEAAVSPASTTVLAVARKRAANLDALAPTAVAKLTQEVEAAQVADDALIDLADPLGAFTRIAAARPTAAAAADALEASAQGALPGATPAPAASATAAPGAGLSLAAGGSILANLPEAPSGLAAYGEHVLAVLPTARAVWSDSGREMKEAARLDFTPSALAVNASDAYVFDRAGGRFVRFALQDAGGKLGLTAAEPRKFPLQPAPRVDRAAVDAAGQFLLAASESSVKLGTGDLFVRLPVVGGAKLTGASARVLGVACSGLDTFWVGTDAASGNLYQEQAGTKLGAPLTIPQPIRDVAVAPDGTVYVATTNPKDGLLRVSGGVVTSLRVHLLLDHLAVTSSGLLRALVGKDLYAWDRPFTD